MNISRTSNKHPHSPHKLVIKIQHLHRPVHSSKVLRLHLPRLNNHPQPAVVAHSQAAPKALRTHHQVHKVPRRQVVNRAAHRPVLHRIMRTQLKVQALSQHPVIITAPKIPILTLRALLKELAQIIKVQVVIKIPKILRVPVPTIKLLRALAQTIKRRPVQIPTIRTMQQIQRQDPTHSHLQALTSLLQQNVRMKIHIFPIWKIALNSTVVAIMAMAH